jgi:hypothetical protein
MVRKLTIALIATAALGTAALASASACSHITNPDKLDLRGYPIAEVEQDFDTVQRRACFQFKSLVPDLTFDPDNLCVSIDDDERQPVFLKLPSGKFLDISGDYSSETLRWEFDRKFKACHGLLGPPV